MMTAASLSLIAALEAVVHLWRIRSANSPSVLQSTLSVGAVALLRITGLGAVVSAVTSDAFAVALVAYVGTAMLANGVLHHYAYRSPRDDQRPGRMAGGV